MIKKIALTAGTAILAFTLAGCTPATETPATGTGDSSTAEAIIEAPAETVEEASYPQQWIDLKIPEIPNTAIVSGEYLEVQNQTRVVAETIVAPEDLTEFGNLLVADGWSEITPGAEYSKEVDGITSVIMINTEREASTFTVFELEV